MLTRSDVYLSHSSPDRLFDYLKTLESGMSGDMAFRITPTTTTRSATSEAWERTVKIELVNSQGLVHEWYTGTLAVSIADTSTAGSAAISDGTPEMVNGVCEVVVSGSEAAWIAGHAQVETATVVGTITGAGNATVIVTGTGIEGSPITLSVAVENGDTAEEVATKIAAAISENTAITETLFTCTHPEGTANVVLTRKTFAANIADLNIDINNGNCTGLTDAPTSVPTQVGNAVETNTLTLSNKSINGVTVTGGTSVETITT